MKRERGSSRNEREKAGHRGGTRSAPGNRPPPAVRHPLAPAPPLWRDPWAWASVLAVIPVVLHALGAPLGEPAAEDFDFLHRALLEHRHTLLDGGGSLAFWRPLSHQVYYLLFGPLMLAHPRAIAAIHVLALGVGSLLIYRMLRGTWPGYAAAAAAAFPLLADSTRTIITWPTHSVDLGSFFFSAIALHEAARRRLPTSLAALLAALLCKEVNVVTALMLPWVPRAAPTDRRTRVRWAGASLALVALWAVAYLAIRRHAGLELPHGLERDPALLATPIPARLAWAAWNSVRAIFSLALAPGRWDIAVGAAVAGLIAIALAGVGLGARGRQRLRAGAPWTLWGLAWFGAAGCTLATIYPLWAPARTLYGSIGLGIALAGLLSAAHPALLASLLVVKLAAFGLSPSPPRDVRILAPEHGAFTDFERIGRLQRLMRDTRDALAKRYPTLPRGGRVGLSHLPRVAEYAFEGSRSLQVWYRDSTLRWVRPSEFMAHPELPLVTIAEFELASGPRQVALLEAEAQRSFIAAFDDIRASRYPAALAKLARADSLARDPAALVFAGQVAGVRAIALAGMNRFEAAELEGRRACMLWRGNTYGHHALAYVAFREGKLAAAEAEVDSALGADPTYAAALALRDAIMRAAAAALADSTRATPPPGRP